MASLLKTFLLLLVLASGPVSHGAVGDNDETSLVPFVKAALNRSLGLKSEEYRLQQAGMAKKDAWAKLLPSLSLSAGRTWSKAESESSGTTVATSTEENSLSLSGSWTLWDHARSWREVYVADLDKRSAELSNEKERESLVVQIVEAYLGHLVSFQRFELAKKFMDQSKLTKDESDTLLKLGVITAIEAMDSEIQFLNAERDLMESKLEVENSERNLRALLNLSETDVIATLPLLSLKPYYLPRFENVRERLIKTEAGSLVGNSWEEKIGNLTVERAQTSYRQAQWDIWPKLSLKASQDWDFEQTINPDNDGYRPVLSSASLSLTLSWEVWDWFTAKRSADSSGLTYQIVTNDYLDSRRRRVADIQNLISQYNILKKSVDSSALSLEKSRKQLESSRELHRLGRINLLLMNQSMNRYFEAESAYADRLKNLYIAISRIMYITGQSLIP